MVIIFLVLIFSLVLIWEGLYLLKTKSYKDLLVFNIFMIFSFTLALLQILGVQLPNPTAGIEFLVNQVSNIKFNFLQ